MFDCSRARQAGGGLILSFLTVCLLNLLVAPAAEAAFPLGGQEFTIHELQNSNTCIEMKGEEVPVGPDGGDSQTEYSLFPATCDINNKAQRWTWDDSNDRALIKNVGLERCVYDSYSLLVGEGCSEPFGERSNYAWIHQSDSNRIIKKGSNDPSRNEFCWMITQGVPGKYSADHCYDGHDQKFLITPL